MHSSRWATSLRHDYITSALPMQRVGRPRSEWEQLLIRFSRGARFWEPSPPIQKRHCFGTGGPASLASAKPSSGSKLSRPDPLSDHTLGPRQSESRKERELWLANTLVETAQQRVQKIRNHSAGADFHLGCQGHSGNHLKPLRQVAQPHVGQID